MNVLRVALCALATIACLAARGEEPQSGRIEVEKHGRGGGVGMMLGLCDNPFIVDEIKLTEEQQKQASLLLKEFQTPYRALGIKYMVATLWLSQEERLKRNDAWLREECAINQEFEEKLSKSLDAGQMDRLVQLTIQFGRSGALTKYDLATQLELTHEQFDKIVAIHMKNHRPVKNAGKVTIERRQAGDAETVTLTPEEKQALINARTAKGRELAKKKLDEMLAVLTEQQRKKFDELRGKEFEFRDPSEHPSRDPEVIKQKRLQQGKK